MPQPGTEDTETTDTYLERKLLMLWTFIVLGVVIAGLGLAFVFETTRIPNHDLDWVFERDELLAALRRLDHDQ